MTRFSEAAVAQLLADNPALRVHQPAAAGSLIGAPSDAAARGPRRILLPWAPSGNHGTKHAHGAHYLTAEHKAYRRTVADLVAGLRLAPVVGRMRVECRMAPPDRRRRDLDNAWKVVGDALQCAGLYADDCAIDDLRLIRLPPIKGGAIQVIVESIE